MLLKLSLISSWVILLFTAGWAGLMQQLPAIPDQVKDESLVAVLFLILLFFAFGLAVLTVLLVRLPPLVKSLTEALDRRAASNVQIAGEIKRGQAEILAEIKRAVDNSTAVRAHIHERITPIMHAQALALLKLVRMEDVAKELEKQDKGNGRE